MPSLHVSFPLGLGDCYWVLTKIPALRRLHQGYDLVAHVWKSPDHHSVDLLRLCPWVNEAREDEDAVYDIYREMEGGPKHPRWSQLEHCRGWQKGPGRRVFDYLLVANGHLEVGEPLCTWLPELGLPEYDVPFNTEACPWPTPRVLLYPSGISANRGFRTEWGPTEWQRVVELLNAAGVKPTFVGAATENDLRYWEGLKLRGDFENLIGQTSTEQYLALIKNCRAWYGLNSGGGILAASFKVPTVMLWSDATYGGVIVPKQHRSWTNNVTTYHPFSYGSPKLIERSVAKLLEVKR